MNGSLKCRWGLGCPEEHAVARAAGARGDSGAPLLP